MKDFTSILLSTSTFNFNGLDFAQFFNDWTLPITIFGGLVTAFIAQRVVKKGQPENQFIDQLQEQLKEIRTDVTDLKTEIASLKMNLETETYKRRGWEEAYYNLRSHYLQGNPPPAPPLPSHLVPGQQNNNTTP